MADMEFYNVGDYVMLNQNGEKLIVGRIEEIMQQYGTFSYILFSKPEDTYCGRLPYHGKNEIVKYSGTIDENFSNIVSKVDVYKLSDYAKLNKEDKFANNKFVCRQNYDPSEERLSPDLEPDCFCDQIINPDDELIVCDCERIFHYQCIPDEDAKCPTCGYTLLSAGEGIYKKRKQEEDKSVLLKSKNEDEFYEMFTNALDDAVADKVEPKQAPANSMRSLNEKRPISALELKKNRSNPITPKSAAPTKKFVRKELTNIDDEAFQRIRHAIDNFSKAHQNRNMSDIDRMRYFTKERYYRSLLYGVEEVKGKLKAAGTASYLSEEQKIIALKDQRENYKLAQELAMSIEATMWHALNKNKNRIDPNYTMKTRELLNYLTDDNNSELRLNILIGERKPEDLCTATGKDLISKGMTEKLEKKEKNTIKQSLLPDEVKIIAKSHKGEVVIEQEPEPVKQNEPIKEPEPIEEENVLHTLTDIVNKFDRKPSESLQSGDMLTPKSYRDTEFDEFRLTKKLSATPKSGNGEFNFQVSPTDKRTDRTSTSSKNYEDILKQISGSVGNKMIDQTVLKNIGSYFFEETYKKLSDRLSNHLKPETARSMIREVRRNQKLE